MFSREITLKERSDGKFELRWKVGEGFYQILVLTNHELESVISDYRKIK